MAKQKLYFNVIHLKLIVFRRSISLNYNLIWQHKKVYKMSKLQETIINKINHDVKLYAFSSVVLKIYQS